MFRAIKLNATNLYKLPNEVKVPNYDRSMIKKGIIHIGVGNFHRAHQAYYTDRILNQDRLDWGICGIGIREEDVKMKQVLMQQDGLYTLIVKELDGTMNPRVIGSIVEYIFAPEDPEVAIKKMATREVKIISLTITEGGYNYDTFNGYFMFGEPSIQWDLNHPEHPKTIFGYLTQGLKRRRDHGLPGLTILSCDNIQQNGDICRKMLMTYIEKAEPGLMEWMKTHVSFPNCMVDRITPITVPSDIDQLKNQYGIEDKWPVVCEPFIQWVIEDDFINGRPEWEQAGVQLVQEVAPYEKMKIRLLNAGHSLLGLSGSLYGYQTIDRTVSDPLLVKLLRKFMNEEVTPILGKIEGIDLKKYKDSLIQRFGNPNIKDLLPRICGESSAKIPKFLLPTIREQLKTGGPIRIGTFIVAAWCRYLEVAGTPGFDYKIQDTLAKELIKAAKSSVYRDPLSFLKIKTVFGDLVDSKRFVDMYLEMIQQLRQYRVEDVIRRLI